VLLQWLGGAPGPPSAYLTSKTPNATIFRHSAGIAEKQFKIYLAYNESSKITDFQLPWVQGK